jgi:hypothetical protein
MEKKCWNKMQNKLTFQHNTGKKLAYNARPWCQWDLTCLFQILWKLVSWLKTCIFKHTQRQHRYIMSLWTSITTSWKADSRPASQESSSLLRKPKLRYCVKTSSSPQPYETFRSTSISFCEDLLHPQTPSNGRLIVCLQPLYKAVDFNLGYAKASYG